MICDWSISDLPGLNKTEQASLVAVAPDALTKQKLAVSLGTKIQYVNKLVALSDLAQLAGIGCQYNGLLIHAGIISLKQLAQTPAHKIHQQLLKLHVATIQRRDLCPDLAQVQNWIRQARELAEG
jgi:predicted flap endonuclease-1-like 5' DNA nuclease